MPDLLGYGGTDKPLTKEEYRLKKMSNEVAGILDACGAEMAIGVGHDWYADGDIFALIAPTLLLPLSMPLPKSLTCSCPVIVRTELPGF